MTTPFSILSDEFTQAALAAWERARARALEEGHPVFYQGDDGRYILERPDGMQAIGKRHCTGLAESKNNGVSRGIVVVAINSKRFEVENVFLGVKLFNVTRGSRWV